MYSMMTYSSLIQTLKFNFFEDIAIDSKSIEDVSYTSVPTKKDDKVLFMIGDESTGSSGLPHMGAWKIQLSYSFRDFMVDRD
jgi:hypothetical protein